LHSSSLSSAIEIAPQTAAAAAAAVSLQHFTAPLKFVFQKPETMQTLF
jgi:hypothetical protein